MDGLIDEEKGSNQPISATSLAEDGRASTPSDASFDQWLAHHLGRLYDPVANEPIPPDLLRLLESRLR